MALTGGIATGKSYVRTRFEAAGVPTIDADSLSREAIAPNTPGFAAVIDRFGSRLLAADGTLDRRALATVVFADPIARRDLEQIVHPAVRRATEQWFSRLDPAEHAFAIADIPLLFETGRATEFDAIVLTSCSPATQLQRLLAREGMSDVEARQRIAAQLPTDEKVPRANFVINTDGTFAETDTQVDDVIRRLATNHSNHQPPTINH